MYVVKSFAAAAAAVDNYTLDDYVLEHAVAAEDRHDVDTAVAPKACCLSIHPFYSSELRMPLIHVA